MTLLYALQYPSGSPEHVIVLQNHAFNLLEPRRIVRHVLHGQRHRLSIDPNSDSDLKRLFAPTGLGRRGERCTPVILDEIPETVMEIVDDWLDIAAAVDPTTALESKLPEDMAEFMTMFQYFMPRCLDANSSVAKELLDTQGLTCKEQEMPYGLFRSFEPWMAENNGLRMVRQPDGSTVYTRTFCSDKKVGGIVFWPVYSTEIPVTEAVVVRYFEVNRRIAALEDVPISLSRRIARYVVTRIMQDYVLPEAEEQGVFVLNKHQLDEAVLDPWAEMVRSALRWRGEAKVLERG